MMTYITFQHIIEWYDVTPLISAKIITYFISSRTLESLCQELVEQGLLKQANNVKMNDYLGKALHAVCVEK